MEIQLTSTLQKYPKIYTKPNLSMWWKIPTNFLHLQILVIFIPEIIVLLIFHVILQVICTFLMMILCLSHFVQKIGFKVRLLRYNNRRILELSLELISLHQKLTMKRSQKCWNSFNFDFWQTSFCLILVHQLKWQKSSVASVEYYFTEIELVASLI